MLIGLHGKARSGKDTAFNFIDEYFDKTAIAVYHKSFAYPLKVSALAALGIETGDPLGTCDKLKEQGWVTGNLGDGTISKITGREYLQKYGTEAHRDVFGQDFWVKTCLPDDFDHNGKVVVVTDVRFPNEAERIRKLDGKVWQIIRGEQSDEDTHASEQPLPDVLIDAVIHNSAGLVDLKEAIGTQVTETINRQIGGKVWFKEESSVVMQPKSFQPKAPDKLPDLPNPEHKEVKM